MPEAPPPAPPLGILMLDTAFPRPPGDVGHPATWPFPVRFRTVAGATARRVVDGDDGLLDAFVAAGAALAREGAVGLTTSCGFLARHQRALAARLPVPVATSSLLLLPLVERCLPAGRRAGVVTYDATALTDRHFSECGADPATPRVGLSADGAFRALIEGGAAYDRPALAAEAAEAARSLLAGHPGIGAIVLECTNLPPFARDLAAAFRLPVHDVVTLGRWLHAGLAPAPYALS
ncbi:aspartate/glutamate racemase family protein [Methylobacterium oryzihabitans]|uniref:Aspartate/glutamate racemase family protein n=1 Tax=Methylobacterium oryzihabitans TaxID=2499852 RepID=A0A3S2VQC3_9HYPH|nr:aspartate/glutamate racemase family protein [Methylobacterium oryzihabitans]RVU14532.1 aspartate/glutamate racemase family protein [Methylobacterium oryzihabitans]